MDLETAKRGLIFNESAKRVHWQSKEADKYEDRKQANAAVQKANDD